MLPTNPTITAVGNETNYISNLYWIDHDLCFDSSWWIHAASLDWGYFTDISSTCRWNWANKLSPRWPLIVRVPNSIWVPRYYGGIEGKGRGGQRTHHECTTAHHQFLDHTWQIGRKLWGLANLPIFTRTFLYFELTVVFCKGMNMDELHSQGQDQTWIQGLSAWHALLPKDGMGGIIFLLNPGTRCILRYLTWSHTALVHLTKKKGAQAGFELPPSTIPEGCTNNV